MASREKNELKQQGAIEAAQDPNTKVSSEDAQKVLVNETKKAGGQAFEFDPNASPEEKAAQARARVPEGFHHEHKPKGVGLVSDIDDGTPDQYDLPPPSKDGALEVTSADVNGEGKANGVVDEDQRWARDRVGWAPRFGNGDAEDDDGATLLDHQTFLEGKLDDKFFGDWYHNTAVIIFACISSWLIAVLGGGLGWVFFIMAACGTYYRTSIRRVRRNFRDDVHREMAKARIETDNESLEWINNFLLKFWPIYEPVLCDTIIMSVDQVLSTSTPAFLDSLRLKTFVLGSKPPRLEHVKTYPKAEDDTVLMDWKFGFTPNDTMDLTARQLKNKINPKIVLEVRVGKAMISKGLDVIVEDFAFSGLMRIKVKLQIPFPHIEKVDMCFLERPEIDYVCKPLGGDTFGFDINFIPGLESFIKEMIHGNLEPLMYAPNVFPIEVAKMLAGNPVDLAIGVVAVTLHGAQGLKNPDKFSGTPDPYVSVSLNSKDELARTKTVHENANPKWNETKYIIITNFTESLTLQVYDYNEYRKSKELGVATFPLDQLEQVDEHENMQLEVSAGGRARGVLQADIRFFPVLGGTKKEDGTEEPAPETNTGIARVTIEQCKELDGNKSLVGKLNPYAVLLLNGKEVHTTGKLKHTNNPIFPNPSKELLITDRKTARIGLIIKDNRDLVGDPIVGKYQIKVDQMLQLIEKGQEWFQLADTKTGRAKLTLNWKPVALKGIAGTGGYVTPIGVMRIHFQRARDLRNFETLGKSDPYARVLLSGIEKGKTVTWRNNLNPDWDEVVYVPVHSAREKLTLEVMDSENLGKDRSLGSVEITTSDFIFESEEGGYAVHDKKTPVAAGLRLHNKGEPKGTLHYSAAFYPTLNVLDPEEEEAEKGSETGTGEKPSLDVSRKSVESTRTRRSTNPQAAGSIDTVLANRLTNGTSAQNGEMSPTSTLSAKKELPKIKLTPEDLTKYESGLIVFKIIEGTFSRNNCQLEVVMDDMVFPSYISSKARSKHFTFGEVGDAMVRELDVSKITLRLTEKVDNKGEEDEEDHVIAKVTGQTLSILQQSLYKPHELTLKGQDGTVSKVTVQLKYLPISMKLDPSESINNMGTLRVDILDAAELPAADRNGYSDPYCKFKYNGKEVFKTKVQKKTLHPAWNEFFELQIKSRTASDLKCEVYDWDFGDKADFLGAAAINLELLEPFQPQEMTFQLDGKSGAVRLKMLFKPDYVTRSRQGSSTFSGTFAPAGKVVGAPVKGVGLVGGGVIKGASFLKRGLAGKNKEDKPAETATPPNELSQELTPQVTPSRATTLTDGSPAVVSTPSPHQRTRSFGSFIGGTPKGGSAETGTAQFTILSASGYPQGAHVRVTVNQLGPKKTKEIHETKTVKAPASGAVEFGGRETFKASCSADTQFQVQVQDHKMFGGTDLGEALFFVDDQGTGGAEKTVKAGAGTVVLRSSFTPAAGSSTPNGTDSASLRPPTSGRDSPDNSRKSVRRSLLSKREARPSTSAGEGN
ncbi:putative membrane bound c2 domain protein [Phaeomoniella chlamydospora]|uniref:Putative membrane bound c2 domain protein n=1 Tax=Phaeomoniella chlamydospora TaxID=158046 RepID=A0A0G2EQB5_PHACM|nr:putative membrane bound c2 domain protein [Phaeomoniella chlamydospora]